MTQHKPRLTILLVLIASGWMGALVWLLRIPADPKNAVLLGLSAARLVLAAGSLVMVSAALAVLWKLRRSPDLRERASELLCRVPVFVGEYIAFILMCIAVCRFFCVG